MQDNASSHQDKQCNKQKDVKLQEIREMKMKIREEIGTAKMHKHKIEEYTQRNKERICFHST